MTSGVEARDRARVRDLKHDLGSLATSGVPMLEWVVPRLHELLDSATTMTYHPEQREDGWGLGVFAQRGWTEQFIARYEREALRANAFPAYYSPLRPAAAQRNRVHRLWVTDWRTGEPSVRRVIEDVWPRVGLAGCDQLRALVCEGPFLVAWVGGFRPGGFSTREEDLFRALLPTLRRAAILGRKLENADLAVRGLEAALEVLAAPAFVVSSLGAVDHANTSGRAVVARLGRGLPATVRGWLRAPPPGASVTRLATRGQPGRTLVVLFGTGDEIDARARRVAARWGLTRRQSDVLRHLVCGDTNKVIGAKLALSEATVEIHVTALLRKTRTENRSALVALFWQRS